MIFDAMQAKNACVSWIQAWFLKNGHDSNAVIGISGGKDSSVVAALCVEALGADAAGSEEIGLVAAAAGAGEAVEAFGGVLVAAVA